MKLNISQNNNHGSALILTVGFVALVVSLGSVFLVNASKKLDESVSVKLALYAEHAAQSAFVHARKDILDDYAQNTYTSLKSKFRTSFCPVDTDGNPLHVLYSWAKPQPTRGDSQRLNVPDSDRITYHALETYQNQKKSPDQWDEAYGFGFWNSVSSRYHDLYFLDADGKIIDDEAAAYYVVRYAAEIADENGKIGINANFPGHPIPFDFSDPDNADYLASQSYIHRYAKAIRSMTGAPTQEGQQSHFASNNADTEQRYVYRRTKPLEGLDVTGSKGYKTSGFVGGDIMFFDSMFRGSGLAPVGGEWAVATPGKIFSYPQIRSWHQGTDVGDYLWRRYSPYTSGSLDQSWPAGQQGFSPTIATLPAPNCPWRVNAATMTQYAMQSMIFGLSSHLRKDNTMTLDLFGPNYPEAFPLPLDSGKHVHLIGVEVNEHNEIVNGTHHLPGYPMITRPFRYYGFDQARFMYKVPKSYGNSYWWDVGGAMWKALAVSRAIWNFDIDHNDTNPNKELKAYDPNCKISTTPGDLSADPNQMLADLEMEFLRILGEDVTIIASGSSFSYSMNPGLLATPNTGNTVTIGFGTQTETDERYHGNHKKQPSWQKEVRDGSRNQHACFAERQCRLRSSDNTRAMEYLLNDVRMSLLGSPALNFNMDDPNNDGSAGTNANDADAESTYNGWWDIDSSGNRVRKWSWYFEGLEQTHNAGNEWLQSPGWYRFYQDGSPSTEYWDGATWKKLTATEQSLFFQINKAFLDDDFLGSGSYPIKPWSATGRLYVGHSRVFNIVARGELFDLIENKRLAKFRAEQILHVDPNRDDDLSDTTVIYQRTYGRNKFGGSTSD